MFQVLRSKMHERWQRKPQVRSAFPVDKVSEVAGPALLGGRLVFYAFAQLAHRFCFLCLG